MPAEIQNMILARAGVLTLWINGRIDDAKLDVEKFKALLSDVFELDWQGDLTKMPFQNFYFDKLVPPLWRIRTRSMHARIKALCLSSFDNGLDQAAIVNGWTDLLDFGRPAELAKNATRCGSIWMLEHLVDVRKVVTIEMVDVCLAAQYGHLNLLMWLHEQMPDGSWKPWVMNSAASNGHLDCVKWLHANRTEGCTTSAMDLAAQSGNLSMIVWLHNNRTEGCTTEAMDWAATNGHLAIVKFLHANRAEGCTTKAMDWAAGSGHLEVVKWLHENRTEGCTSDAIKRAAQYGHADVVEFLHRNRTEGSIADAAKAAARAGSLNLIMCIRNLAPDAIDGSLVNESASSGEIPLLEWLINETGVMPTADALTFAVYSIGFCILPWFRDRMPGIFHSHAVSKVGNESADAVIDWFKHDDLPTSASWVMDLAIEEHQVVVVKWLLEHLPYGGWDGDWDRDTLRQARELLGTA
ncbi:hypothetical protein HK105_203517 [Polyrhizophydium stewartii]|uniref:Ankyrin repeat protein n=1 Tax=Polyrhizophydium stewartii TaxID=2732419 RepID=A0ABR4NB35_9FUNG